MQARNPGLLCCQRNLRQRRGHRAGGDLAELRASGLEALPWTGETMASLGWVGHTLFAHSHPYAHRVSKPLPRYSSESELIVTTFIQLIGCS